MSENISWYILAHESNRSLLWDMKAEQKSMTNDLLLESIILAISAKLSADSLTRKRYTFKRAERILSKCVAPFGLIRVLKSHETEIKKQLL